MRVLVRIPGSGSTCNLAKFRNKALLIVFASKRGASNVTDLSVHSLNAGDVSRNPPSIFL